MRIFTFSIYVSLLGLSWYAIYIVNVKAEVIEEYMKTKFRWGNYVAPFIPSICLAMINTIIPIFTNMLIQFE